MDMNKIFSKVFLWMFVGLAVTFGIAYYVSMNENMIYNLFSGHKYMIILILEIVIAIVLSARIHKLNPIISKLLFLLYAGLTGLTFSTIFIVYELTSIMYIFGLTSILFLIFGLIGYFTKIDLTKFGIYFVMALLGIIIVSFINMFVGSQVLDLGLCAIGIILFLGFIAYDIQIIKRNLYGLDNEENFAIIGAFELYLDFINLFIKLLRLFGKRRN